MNPNLLRLLLIVLLVLLALAWPRADFPALFLAGIVVLTFPRVRARLNVRAL